MAAGRAGELLWSRMDVPTSSPGQHFGNGTFLEAEFTHDEDLTSQTPWRTNTPGAAGVWHQSAGHISEILSQLWARRPKAQTSQSPSSWPNKSLILPEQSSARPPTDGTWGREQKTKTSAERPQEWNPLYPVSSAPSPTLPHTVWGGHGKTHQHLVSLRFSI